MGDFLTNLKDKFKRGNISLQFIYINVGVFLVISLTTVLWMLFNRAPQPLLMYFELPAYYYHFISQPWSIFTYMFIHVGVFHLLFNMLWLYWFGNIFLYFFSAKHLRGLYILGGICGGALYMLFYNIFPYFEPSVPYSYLIGASASVLAIVLATAYREPDYRVNLLFFGAIRLKYIALFMVISDLLFMTSDNAGGHIAHLGGALAGLLFAWQLKKGTDVTLWINNFLDWIVGLFYRKPKKKPGKAKMKVHYGTRVDDYNYNANKKVQAEEVDRILDKLKKSGYDSLTGEEKKRLFDASKK